MNRHDANLAEDVAAATAECGMQQLANWLPADRHTELRELLYDLAFGALHAFADRRAWYMPEPSEN